MESTQTPNMMVFTLSVKVQGPEALPVTAAGLLCPLMK
jgi:hypothetical protein